MGMWISYLEMLINHRKLKKTKAMSIQIRAIKEELLAEYSLLISSLRDLNNTNLKPKTRSSLKEWVDTAYLDVGSVKRLRNKAQHYFNMWDISEQRLENDLKYGLASTTKTINNWKRVNEDVLSTMKDLLTSLLGMQELAQRALKEAKSCSV